MSGFLLPPGSQSPETCVNSLQCVPRSGDALQGTSKAVTLVAFIQRSIQCAGVLGLLPKNEDVECLARGGLRRERAAAHGRFFLACCLTDIMQEQTPQAALQRWYDAGLPFKFFSSTVTLLCPLASRETNGTCSLDGL
jgi:hypothetical protein